MESLYTFYQYLINNYCCKHLFIKITENEYDLDRISKYTQHQIGRQRNIISRIILEVEKFQNEIIFLFEDKDIEYNKIQISINKLRYIYSLLNNYSCNNLFIDEQCNFKDIPNRTLSTKVNKVLKPNIIVVGQKKVLK